MKGDELAIALHKRQGYLIVGMNNPVTIGTILPPETAGNERSRTTDIRLIIVGAATRAEFVQQSKLVCELAGIRVGSMPHVLHFYRVEAAD